MRALSVITCALTLWAQLATPTADDAVAQPTQVTDAGTCDYRAFRRSTCT